MKIYVTGAVGTGKTSIAAALAATGINAVDTDELSHWENKLMGERTEWEPGGSDEWYGAHAWVCDVDRLKSILAKTENAAAIGHASNQEEYLKLFDKVFVLSCSPETVVSRIEQRTNNDFGKHPSDMKRLLEWHKGFEAWMVEKGAEVLNTERPLEEIVRDIRSSFDSARNP